MRCPSAGVPWERNGPKNINRIRLAGLVAGQVHNPAPYRFARPSAARYTPDLSRLPTAITVTSTIVSSTW